MIEQGVCAAMSSAEYKCNVCPFLVNALRFADGKPGSGFSVFRNAVSEVWCPTLVVGLFLRGDMTSLCPESELKTFSTEPSVDISRSSKVAWSRVGKREDRVASFRSVVSSWSATFVGGWG